jgi:hypothetical protein
MWKQTKYDQWQTGMVQLLNFIQVLLYTLFKASNDLMPSTDFLISSLRLFEMHQVALLSLELSSSTVADFYNRTDNV